MKARVEHWRFESGIPVKHDGPQSAVDAALAKHGLDRTMPYGWYCWVYPESGQGPWLNKPDRFEKWMRTHCPKADVTFRFNSGDPMYTVHINDDQECTVFCLMFGIA